MESLGQDENEELEELDTYLEETKTEQYVDTMK